LSNIQIICFYLYLIFWKRICMKSSILNSFLVIICVSTHEGCKNFLQNFEVVKEYTTLKTQALMGSVSEMCACKVGH
jgi:hypothetical protein